MTLAQKLRLVFQAWYFARKVVWTTEHQAHPNASPEERGWRMLQRLHGKEFFAKLRAQMQQDGLGWADLVQNNPAES